jgi:hypothetical protein
MLSGIGNWLKNHWWKALIAFVTVIVITDKFEDRQDEQRRKAAFLVSPGMSEPPTVMRVEPNAKEPAMTAIMPAPNTDPDNAGEIPREWIYDPPKLPPPTVDVLKRAGIEVENEFPPFMLDEDTIRGAADRAFAVLGTYDESLRGWTLTVRQADDVAETYWIEGQKRAVVRIDIRAVPYALPHELVHVLLGRATREAMMPGFVNEFLANAAELHQQPRPPQLNFDYDRLNRPILGLGQSLTRIEGKIGNDSPLDMERYLLLELAGEKIGQERFENLAAELAHAALVAEKPLTLSDTKAHFDRYGIGDCVLFTQTPGPGIYVDLALTKDGLPYIMYKQVDGQGVESSINQANIRVTLKREGDALFNFPVGSTNPNATFLDPAGMPLFPYADSYEVTIGTHTYVWHIAGQPSGPGKGSTMISQRL